MEGPTADGGDGGEYPYTPYIVASEGPSVDGPELLVATWAEGMDCSTVSEYVAV